MEFNWEHVLNIQCMQFCSGARNAETELRELVDL